MDVFFCYAFRWNFGFTLPSCWLAQVSRHTTAITVAKTERITNLSNYFSRARAVFSSGPQKGVQTVSWEMVTSSAQTLHKELSSPPCWLCSLTAPTPPAPDVTAKCSAGVNRQSENQPRCCPRKQTNVSQKSDCAQRQFYNHVLINSNKN